MKAVDIKFVNLYLIHGVEVSPLLFGKRQKASFMNYENLGLIKQVLIGRRKMLLIPMQEYLHKQIEIKGELFKASDEFSQHELDKYEIHGLELTSILSIESISELAKRGYDVFNLIAQGQALPAKKAEIGYVKKLYMPSELDNREFFMR